MAARLLYVPSALFGLEVPREIREPVHYLCHAIFCGRAIRRSESQWIPLNAAILKTVHRSYVAARRWLIDAQIVECNGSYQTGVTSMGYRWLVPYVSAKRHPTTMAFARRLARLQAHSDANLPFGARHLIRQLKRIHIDAEAAYETVAHLGPKSNSPWSIEAYRSFLSTTVRLIEDRELYSVVDDFGRLHTPFTSLHRELRQHLYVQAGNGERHSLVNLDIRNSQPLTLALLLTSDVPSEKYIKVTATNDQRSLEQIHVSPTPPTEDDPYVGKTAEMRHGHPSDDSGVLFDERRARYGYSIADYIDTCERGRFYESLMHFCPTVRDAGGFMSPMEQDDLRRQFKVQVFGEIMFGPVKDTELSRTFREIWPKVWERIKAEKSGPDGYPALARAMQRAESRLMIDRIGARLSRDVPEVPVASIHDSFLVPAQHADEVKHIILQEWSGAGLRPTIAIKSA